MKTRRPLILASSSPRRHYLMNELGFEFSVKKPGVDEIIPPGMAAADAAKYLAAIKAESLLPAMLDHVVLTADTVVILNNRILNKPTDRNDAINILSALSGNTHRVMTGVTIMSKRDKETFDDTTDVTFEKLTRDEIEFYIDHFQPYDKAGAYGAQDCLPQGMNPCSPEERTFLKSINKEALISKTITHPPDKAIVIIKKISGSYFNVMGLPIQKVFPKLCKFLEK